MATLSAKSAASGESVCGCWRIQLGRPMTITPGALGEYPPGSGWWRRADLVANFKRDDSHTEPTSMPIKTHLGRISTCRSASLEEEDSLTSCCCPSFSQSSSSPWAACSPLIRAVRPSGAGLASCRQRAAVQGACNSTMEAYCGQEHADALGMACTRDLAAVGQKATAARSA